MPLDYRNYGIFLIMGNAGFTSSTVVVRKASLTWVWRLHVTIDEEHRAVKEGLGFRGLGFRDLKDCLDPTKSASARGIK